MKRSVIAAALAAGLVLAGCDNGGTEPAPPPTSEEALSTATAPPTPSDEVEVTTEAEAAPTTEAPEADGPPEMPEEAMEQTEAGAAAFALHYVDLINYTGMHPETGLLEPLGGEDCQSCRNHEETVSYSVQHGEVLLQDLWDAETPTTSATASSALVRVPISQKESDVVNAEGDVVETVEGGDYVLVFDLSSAETGWVVDEIQIEVS